MNNDLSEQRADGTVSVQRRHWIHSVNPIERGLPRALVELVLHPGRLTRRWRSNGRQGIAPIQIYLATAAIAFATTSFLGEINTGVLYVFGGGVFGKLEKWGAWLAFALTVPIVAGALYLPDWRRKRDFEYHLSFALHVQAFVFLAIAGEALGIWLAPQGSVLWSIARYGFGGVAAAYTIIALIDGFEDKLGVALARGVALALIYGSAFIAAAVLLASTTAFRL